MTNEAVIPGTHRILVEEFELAESDLSAAADLNRDLGLDSLDMVDLMVALKRQFGFKIVRAVDEEKIRELRTLQQIYAFIQEKMEADPQQT